MLIGTLFEMIAPLKPQLRERQLLHDAETVISEAPSSAVDLTRPREWSEAYRRRPNDPPTFGMFFETRNLSDREVRMRETVASGQIIDPSLARRAEWEPVDQYQWSVFAADGAIHPANIRHLYGAIPWQPSRLHADGLFARPVVFAWLGARDLQLPHWSPRSYLLMAPQFLFMAFCAGA